LEPHTTPTEEDARSIIQLVLHEPANTVTRFTTGLAHYVYDVITASNRAVVVRMAHPDASAHLAGATYWSARLRPRGVPLPRILAADVEAVPFPFLLLERLPGTDLGHVYPQLSAQHKRAIAAEVVSIQALVGELPLGLGFGYTSSYEASFPQRTWADVLLASLARSRARIAEAGVFDTTYIDRVHAHFATFEAYLARVRPVAFLDDTTTKNVLVQDGRLSGIVDVDVVCFGDPIWTIGLTQMALLSCNYDIDYLHYWCDLAGLTAEQRHVLTFYTAIFCIDFMSEIGQTFNQATAMPAETQYVQQLIHIFDSLIYAI
jgi:aminoglycoside phosphotransferase (APT) family kinase protein